MSERMPDLLPAEECPICRMPKRPERMGSITQWISVCRCEVISAETGGDGPQVRFCNTCGKRVDEGRPGSFTQWIFRSPQDICNCSRPASLRETNDKVDRNEEIDPIDEPELSLTGEPFPTERYKPISILGEGASGTVYMCRDRLLNKKVALKVLNFISSDQLILFQREAKATSKLSHPGIVRVLDFGVSENSQPYMVLEFVDGISLEKTIRDLGPLNTPYAIEVFSHIADSLAYSHSYGIFHRDLKPSNILLVSSNENQSDRSESVRLIDFGVAQVQSSYQEPKVAQDRTLVGTPAYICPEQIEEGVFDARSEVYSFGCVLFEALSGAPPFEAETTLELLQKHVNEEPPALNVRDSDLTFADDLEAFVSKCLAKDPQARFQNFDEVVHALRSLETEETDEGAVEEIERETVPLAVVAPGGKPKIAMPILLIVAAITLGGLSFMYFSRTLTTKESVSTTTIDNKEEEKKENLLNQLSDIEPNKVSEDVEDIQSKVLESNQPTSGETKSSIAKTKVASAAFMEIDRRLKKNPNDENALIMRAKLLLKLQRAKDALTELDQVLRINPKSADAYFLRTQIYFAAGALKPALIDAQKATELRPNWSDAHSALGVLRFYAENDLERGIDELNLAIKLDPKNASAWMNRGALYFKLGHLERSKTDFDRSLELDPNDTQALNGRGRVLHALKRYELAIKDFDRAIKLDPHDNDWFNNKGLALSKLNRFDEAIVWYTKSIEINPKDASPYNNRGAAYLRLKKFNEAERDFKRALKVDPNHAPTHNNFAALLAAKGETAKAKAEVEKSLDLDPDDATAHYNRGQILINRGAYEESLIDLGEAKQKSRSHNYKPLSRGDFQQVVNACSRSLKLNPNDKEALYNRGFAYFGMRDMKSALRDLDEFLGRTEGDSKAAINAAILSNLAQRQLGIDSKRARLIVDRVLKNRSPELQDYWGRNLASYLNGQLTQKDMQTLQLTKTSKTRLYCYFAIDRLLEKDRRTAIEKFEWIHDFGDRSVDEFDLAMSWLSQLKTEGQPFATGM